MKMTRSFVEKIRQLIVAARHAAGRSVDLLQVHVNLEIGRRILEEEQRGEDRAAYGKEVIRTLAQRLAKEFGNGFSKTNLEYMRRFYQLYEDRAPIAQSVTGQLAPGKARARMLQPPEGASGATRIAQTVSGQLMIAEKAGGTQQDADGILRSPSAKSSAVQIAQSTTGQLIQVPAKKLRPFSLSWTHYVFLMSIRNPAERSFYEIESTS